MSAAWSLLGRQTWLYSRFELQRLLLTPRGWFGLAAFSTIWYLLLRYPIYQASVQLQDPQIQQMLSSMLGMVGMYNLMNWSLPELSVYWALTVLLMPLAVLFSAADQTCSDRSRGTLRFLTLRSSRDSIFFGRFIGQMLVQALLLGLSLLATLALAAWRVGELPIAAVNAALVIWLNLLIVLMPFTALMALCSALVKSSRLAISLAIVSMGGVAGLLGYLVWHFPDLRSVLGYLPGAQLPMLLGAQGWDTLKHSVLPLLQTLVLLTAGRFVMQEKAI
jgi:ABC-type transport system involved in multi-copper enzyme maturation permease subunit